MKGVICGKLMWSFKNLDVMRTAWKSIAVPALTYGNGVLALQADTREKLESAQIQVGRRALGCHAYTTNEFIEGELGWSTFESRECIAKVAFKTRRNRLKEGSLVQEVEKLKIESRRGVDGRGKRETTTRLDRRVKFLESKFVVDLSKLKDSMSFKAITRNIKKMVDKTYSEMWKVKMQNKSPLSLYRNEKKEIKYENLLYNQHPGSARLGGTLWGIKDQRICF